MRDWPAYVRSRLRTDGLDPAGEAEIVDEIAQHVAALHAELLERGASQADADAAVEAELDGAVMPRAARRRPPLPPPPPAGRSALLVAQDVRYTLRLFRRRPLAALAAIVTMAVAIGATTAIYSVVKAALLRPLPIPAAHQIVTLGTTEQGEAASTVGFLTYVDWRAQSTSFSALAVMRSWMPTLVADEEPERLVGVRVSANYFGMLGIGPALGRDFRPAEDTRDGWRVVILSDAVWARRFHRDPKVVGRTITLDGVPFRVAGVMPADYQAILESHLYRKPDVWAPLGYDETSDSACRSCEHLKAVGRLRHGVSPEDARAELDAIQTRLRERYPAQYDEARMAVVPLSDALTRPVRPMLFVLLGAAGLVLLVACANVSGLLLLQTASRQHELAIRAALGASGRRVAQQLLTESFTISTAAGLGGAALAVLGHRLLLAVAPPEIPRLETAAVDFGVLLFAAGVTIATAVGVGLLPAARAVTASLQQTLRAAGRGPGSRASRPARRVLVAAQLALAIVLLSAAGLMARTIHALGQVNPGFETQDLLAFQVSFVGPAYREDPAVEAFTNAILERLRALPGVADVATTSQLPLGGNMDRWAFTIEGRSTDPDDVPYVDRYGVTPDYLAVMRIPLLAGRFFTATDTRESEPVVVIGQTTARRLWGARNPIGDRVRLGGPRSPFRRVIGIVGDVRHFDLAAEPTMTAYTPNAQQTDSFPVFVLRSAADVPSLMRQARSAVWSVAGDVPVYGGTTGRTVVQDALALRHFVSGLLIVFAAIAVLLAAVGLYSVVAFSVAERTPEVGVRMALGATRGDVLALVASDALLVVAAGVGAGLAAAVLAVRRLESLLWGVTATDASTYVAVTAFLLAVAGLAHVVPIRRALSVEPALALRQE